MPLNSKQKLALDAVQQGDNCFITGVAGTGKSHLIREIKKTLEGVVACVAPTGIAAVNAGGRTLNSWAGVGMMGDPLETYVKKRRNEIPRFDTPGWRIMNTRTLIIDEISMVSLYMFSMMDRLCRGVRRNDKPFGGIQVVCFGDFFQLPPVPDTKCWGCRGNTTLGEKYTCDAPKNDACVPFEVNVYAFDTCPDGRTPWEDLNFTTFELTQVYRQTHMPFIELLNRVRKGEHTQEDIVFLESLERPLPDDGIMPTKLYTHNANVDSENARYYRAIESPEVRYKAKEGYNDKGMFLVDTLRKGTPDFVCLKIGTQVMMSANVDVDNGLCNGTRGVVTNFVDSEVVVAGPVGTFIRNNRRLPVVTFALVKGTRTCVVQPHMWSVETSEGAKAYLVQIPLKHAWALTIHKSQGLSLSRVQVDLSKCFAPGQAYVALSRAEQPDGLEILALDPSRITTDPKVLAFFSTRKRKHDLL